MGRVFWWSGCGRAESGRNRCTSATGSKTSHPAIRCVAGSSTTWRNGRSSSAATRRELDAHPDAWAPIVTAARGRCRSAVQLARHRGQQRGGPAWLCQREARRTMSERAILAAGGVEHDADERSHRSFSLERRRSPGAGTGHRRGRVDLRTGLTRRPRNPAVPAGTVA